MKVAIISGDFPAITGGISDYSYILARHLAKENTNTTIITSKNSKIKKSHLLKILPVINKWNFFCLQKINQLLNKIKPDVIQIEFPSKSYHRHPAINFLPFYLKLKGKQNIVFTTHEFGLYTWLGKLRQLIAMLFSDKIITVTHDDKKQLEKIFGEKVSHINIGANIFPAKRNEKEIKKIREKIAPNKEKIACFFGRIAQQKGLESLFTALAEVAKQRPIKLLMIGEFESKEIEKKLRERIKQLGIESKIHWTGYLKGRLLSQHFYASDFCVLPFEDGLTFRRGSYLAALVHGLPIISTKTRLTPTCLKHKQNIFFVKPNNKNELTQAMKELGENTKLQALIKKGSTKLLPLFGWKKIAKEHLSVWRSLL